MRITQEADYALRIACMLEQSGETHESASDIADRTSVSARFTLKILRKLVHGGIVRSFKGANGGYALARPASEITLRDIIELIDGPLAISRCIDDSHQCSREGIDKSECILYHIFCRINDEVAGKLGRITIADVADVRADAARLVHKLDE